MTAACTEPFLYEENGSTFRPTALTTGPWRPDAQHGGPPSALLAHLCEEFVTPDEFVARFQVNLLRAVPLEPLTAEVGRLPVSRRVAHVQARLFVGDRAVAEGRALVLSGGELPPPASAPEPFDITSWSDIEPVKAPDWAGGTDAPAFHRDGLEHRFVEGSFDRPGSALDWVRLVPFVVGGRAVTGLQRAMAVVDVGSGISAAFDPASGFGMINADLDVAFVATSTEEWLLLEATTFIGPNGTGMALTRIHDRRGLVGVATQSLLGAAFNPG